ncbi:uncharacterized protein LOC117338175 isoform X2 [Pecten maximus]|uniref:uncharacterized protein LOC117338175 isoform X2 n=1 Tax=Pecten maximus TaxID=6579 RepID=UPI0014585D88|nr:uncharacterized protein LOC117338175 isoform X2 [Pecten maximus]
MKWTRNAREHRRFRRRIYNEGSAEIMDQTTAACAVKEERQTDFTRKLKKRRGSPPTSSPLADGQCFNCLGIFEGLRGSGSCQHHPGFLKDVVWTCCGKEANTTKPCYKDHQETGCNVSIHNWRQRKNSGRKSDTYSRCTAAEDYKLSRACVKPNLRHRTPGRHVVNMWDKQYGTKY